MNSWVLCVLNPFCTGTHTQAQATTRATAESTNIESLLSLYSWNENINTLLWTITEYVFNRPPMWHKCALKEEDSVSFPRVYLTTNRPFKMHLALSRKQNSDDRNDTDKMFTSWEPSALVKFPEAVKQLHLVPLYLLCIFKERDALPQLDNNTTTLLHVKTALHTPTVYNNYLTAIKKRREKWSAVGIP